MMAHWDLQRWRLNAEHRAARRPAVAGGDAAETREGQGAWCSAWCSLEFSKCDM